MPPEKLSESAINEIAGITCGDVSCEHCDEHKRLLLSHIAFLEAERDSFKSHFERRGELLKKQSFNSAGLNREYLNRMREMRESATRLEAENARLREALTNVVEYEAGSARLQGLSGCTCINRSRATELDYENGCCVHQKAKASLPQIKRKKSNAARKTFGS